MRAMVVRVVCMLMIFALSVSVTVSLFYAPSWVTLVALVLLVGALVARHRVTRPRLARGCCRACGYDLTGLEPVGECPECGEAYEPRWDLEAILRAKCEDRERAASAARDVDG